MKRFSASILLLAVLLFIALAGCTPPAAPQAPVSPQPTAARPSQSTAAPVAEDAAWQKVIADAKKEGMVTL